MLLISLSGRHSKTNLALFVLCFGLTVITCAAQPLYLSVDATPYDHQMMRVSPTLTVSQARAANRISLVTVNRWMSSLRSIPYHYSTKWRTPRELRVAREGDCKGKAMALYATMRNNGAHNIYLVIGKHHVMDSQTHAWLEWQTAVGTYLLDPTFNWTITRRDDQSPVTYIPFYAYDGTHKYQASYAPPLLATRELSTVSHAPPSK